MDCPECRKGMIVYELDRVEVDHCVVCGGTWLDKGEFELLGSGQSPVIHKECVEKKRCCPMCLKKMDKVFSGTSAKIFLDQCPKCQGLWFDKGELQAVLSVSGSAVGAAGSFLKEIFKGGVT